MKNKLKQFLVRIIFIWVRSLDCVIFWLFLWPFCVVFCDFPYHVVFFLSFFSDGQPFGYFLSHFFCIFRLLTIHIYEHFSMVNFFRSSCMKISSCVVPNYKLFSVEAVWKFRQVLLLAMNYFSSKLYENSVKWCSWLWTIFRPSWMNVPSRKIFSVQKRFCLKGTVPRDWFWPLDDDTTTVS